MTRKNLSALTIAIALATLSGAAAAQAGGKTADSGVQAISRPAAPSASLQQLQEAADRLRHSIQALAQKPQGAERDRAIANAHDALLRTQQAMLALPPELRVQRYEATGEYDRSVQALMKSADALRHAIQQMAQEPAGERRDQAIRQAHRALWDTQSAMIDAYQPSSAQRAGATAASGSSQPDRQASAASAATGAVPAAVLVLLPAEQTRDQRFANGCWVRFFDDKDYKGEALTLAGPVDIPNMELGDAWREWESAIVGPKATVRTFDNENFRDRTAVLNAGQSIPDLRERKLGWFEEVKSTRVSCS